MKRVAIALLFVAAFGFDVVRMAAEPELTEGQKLKAQVQGLKETVLGLQTQLLACNLEVNRNQVASTAGALAADRKALDDELIKALGGDPEKQDLDRETLTLKPKPAPEKK